MVKNVVDESQLTELLYQALETPLGLPAVLPPPEEVRHVDSATDAARAEMSREGLLKKGH